MSKTVILDNGHGGMINGKYQTAGKRSPDWNKGVLYEGAFNRWITWGIMKELDYARVPYFHASSELYDVALQTRVNRVNEIYKYDKNTYLLSIHANAGGGTGVEGYTTKGNTGSDALCEQFLSDIEKRFPKARMRFDYADHDKDKEKNFYVLRKTRAPACLLELFFMDNRKDYKLLWDRVFQFEIVRSIAKTITDIYKGR